MANGIDGVGRPYVARVVDDELDTLMQTLPAIAVEGPKAVGKTETARRRAGTVHRLDDPAQRTVAVADPARLLRGEPPVLFDEWQRLPECWDLVRRTVDDEMRPDSTATSVASSNATSRNLAFAVAIPRRCGAG